MDHRRSNGEKLDLGSMITPGNSEDYSSFHSQVVGMYGILVTLQQVLEMESGGIGEIEIACNGCSVLERLWSRKTIDLFAAHVDLLKACKNMEHIIPCTVKYISTSKDTRIKATPWHS